MTDKTESPIHRMLESCEDGCEPTDPVTFQWSAKGVGFGQFVFYMQDGVLHCDSELMSKQFIKETLCKMIDNCVLEDI